MMTKKIFCATCLIVLTASATAQYYYKDLVSNKQLIAEMAMLKEQNIRTVILSSFEDDGKPSEGFFGERKINKKFTQVQTRTKSYVTAASEFVSEFDAKGLLTHTTDSSEIASSNAYFSYYDNGTLKSIVTINRSSDDDFKNEIKEEHFYEYNANGNPAKMLRIKNNTDTTIITFAYDEAGNVSIEKNTKNGDTYYYYYDAKKRITDVVRLNPNSQKMLPDYMFEYNTSGQITQMTTTEEGGSYYFVWRYTYENGLRIREKCFSKERRLMGSIEYAYK
jgi:YD repeat-containing protein